ncbi:hypothetical protein FIBSPDRAFT_942988 [Athelia psychrophila]|uniref:Cytochrome P450 n=1 Tax=Athelia psychrophila TaxID=1759441 RepID=A0A166WLF4_9AGAM|nr:hypothetical protein FIBSPDRAFT_942988 [Fibularhizoctonia sp. CBS 109695]
MSRESPGVIISARVVSYEQYNVPALHRGHDVDEFKPEMFINIDRPEDDYTWPRDAFLAFYTGTRGCIGSRFATIESVCILTLLVRHYEVLVPADLDKKDIGPEKGRKTLLAWTAGITITPTGSKVKLRPGEV